MRERLDDPRMRYFIGDVRDRHRLDLAMRGVNVVIHAAALKQVPTCEYNPSEAVATNIGGSENVVRAAIDARVDRVVALSTDKACAPYNLYGATKAVAERLFLAANAYSPRGTAFSVVRYGNISGSRGSVIPVWRDKIAKGESVTIHDAEATRFWFTLDGAVDLVLWTLQDLPGNCMAVPSLPSFKITELAQAMNASVTYGSKRPGDKTHESMISSHESQDFVRADGRYVRGINGGALPPGFEYSSGTNDQWLTVDDLKRELESV